jgi:hypothetical protein
LAFALKQMKKATDSIFSMTNVMFADRTRPIRPQPLVNARLVESVQARERLAHASSLESLQTNTTRPTIFGQLVGIVHRRGRQRPNRTFVGAPILRPVTKSLQELFVAHTVHITHTHTHSSTTITHHVETAAWAVGHCLHNIRQHGILLTCTTSDLPAVPIPTTTTTTSTHGRRRIHGGGHSAVLVSMTHNAHLLG